VANEWNQIVSNLGVAAVNTDWHVVGTGDFNGDGKSDILWRHDSGYVVEWLMNSNQIASNLGVAGVTTDWHIVDKATTSQRCDNPL
jgi:hypothetical protein